MQEEGRKQCFGQGIHRRDPSHKRPGWGAKKRASSPLSTAPAQTTRATHLHETGVLPGQEDGQSRGEGRSGSAWAAGLPEPGQRCGSHLLVALGARFGGHLHFFGPAGRHASAQLRGGAPTAGEERQPSARELARPAHLPGTRPSRPRQPIESSRSPARQRPPSFTPITVSFLLFPTPPPYTRTPPSANAGAAHAYVDPVSGSFFFQRPNRNPKPSGKPSRAPSSPRAKARASPGRGLKAEYFFKKKIISAGIG